MLQHYLVRVALVSTAMTLPASGIAAIAGIWDAMPAPPAFNTPPTPMPPAFQPEHYQPELQLISYQPPSSQQTPLDAGLNSLLDVLARQPLQQVANTKANLTVAHLAATANALLHWNRAISPETLSSQFELLDISSSRGAGAHVTGYFTPELQASPVPTARFNIPIYRQPPAHLAHLSHAEIANGALRGLGLELAWLDDPFHLYLAHLQGSALLHFPDGTRQMIDYAGDNGKKFSSIATYLKQRGYLHGSIDNADVQAWLQANPDKQFEVMTSNPRYIYFHETPELPRTASGGSVIPGHTIAVDSNHIPLGSIILAELPRFADNGQIDGYEWRLLLAQDRGKGVVGNGRIDLYTGIGAAAERRAYQVSGLRRAYLVVRRP